jgi:chemotaxis protein MotB
MSRKAKHPQHENHERWLVSYADFITLMFAFFVVMFAASQTDKSRAKQVSESVQKALSDGQVSSVVSAILGGAVEDKGKGNAGMKGPGGVNTKPVSDADHKSFAELLPSMRYLSSELKEEIAAGKVQVHLEARGLIVSLTEAAFFPPGEATIAPNAYSSIDKIATAMKKVPNPIRLEGHTDPVPIHNSRFRNNWELSSARGIAMLELMTTRCGVPEKQLAVIGYADTSPVESNDTAEGRARNRRVDVVILARRGSEVEPPQKAR